TPSVDAVQEFRLIRNNFSAEYGTHSGSVVDVVTRSGTNEVHGTAFYFHRNDALDAADVFAYYDTATGEKDKSPLKWHQFGFTLGGPIIQEKLFFFGGYEGFREIRGVTAVTNVETPEFRQYVTQNFPDGAAAEIFRQIPALTPNREILTAGEIFAGFGWCYFCNAADWPEDLPVTGIVDASGGDRQSRDQYHLKIDFSLSDNTQIAGRYDRTNIEDTQFFFARPNGGGDLNSGASESLNLSWTQSFSPTTLNEFRFGYILRRDDFSVENPHIPMNYFTGGYGTIDNTVGGFGALPQFFTRDTLQFQDIVSFNVGDHFMRAGVDYRLSVEESDVAVGSRPSLYYTGLFDWATDSTYYVSAGIDPRTGELASTPREFEMGGIGWFIQDDWKVSSRLTLNLGLRWDYFSPIWERNGLTTGMTFPTGETYFERISKAVVGPLDELYRKDLNNFAPRIGFALDLFGDNATSLRGGYGVSYDKIFFLLAGNLRYNPPYFGLVAISDIFFGDDLSGLPRLGDDPNDPYGGFLGQKVLEPAAFDEFGAPVGQTLFLRVMDPDMRDSYVHNLFLGVQRELPWEMVVEFNAQATYGKKLGIIGDPNRFNGDTLGWANPLGEFEGDPRLNRIHPSFAEFNLRQNRITSNYHGFNAQLSKRMSGGLAFQMAYTLGKSLDFNSDVFGSGQNGGGSDIKFADPTNIGIEYGRSNFDIRQRIVSNFLWEMPYRREQEGVLGQILGGWQMTGTVPVQTGLPFGVTCSAGLQISPPCDSNRDGTGFDRPDEPALGNSFSELPSNADFIEGLWEPGDFPSPEPGHNGTLGKNTYSGPHFWSVDLGLFKNFRLPITEESKLQFRAEFFNLFNRVNLYLPRPNLNDRVFFGQSTRSFEPREIQLALKLIW
ncbi:MAG: TonB-dependent receptor, partial [Acidobacteriota bacterium]